MPFQFISKISILLFTLYSLPALADPIGTTKLKAEYKCNVEWQLFPGVIDQKTKKNFTINSVTFVEFESPISLKGYSIYGIGNEFDGEDNKWEGFRLVILKREISNTTTKFTFGMLQSDTTLTPTTDIKESIKKISDGSSRLGMLALDSNNPSQAGFQRAPIQGDISTPYLKPLNAACNIKGSKESVDPFAAKLGYFPKPW
ncbi:MAG: hypothetical protein ACXWQO_15995 [Bdellovibrionota bacterium]